MMTRLIQLMGDAVEELWHFPDDVTDEQIQQWYKEYENQLEEEECIDLFDEFMEEHYPKIECERVFVDEIYV